MFNIAQKNTLQYIILGMRKMMKKTGYDIKTAFTTEIGEFWQAKHSQIYLSYRSLQKKAGLISKLRLWEQNLKRKFTP